MPTFPPDIRALAEFIRVQRADEAGRRSAGSRAYYSALHAVDALFGHPSRQRAPDGESTHKSVIYAAAAYAKQAVPGRTSASIIADQLDKLRRRRNSADYHVAEEFPETMCGDMFERADKILTLCADVAAKRSVQASQAEASGIEETPPQPTPPPRHNGPGLRRVK